MTPAPKRRWLRFSLRTLFVVVTVTLLAAMLAYLRHRGQVRDEALEHLDGMGQYLFRYQYQWKNVIPNMADYSATSHYPRWLLALLYTENLESISFVSIGPHRMPGTNVYEEVTDDDLRSLSWFSEIERLSIRSDQVTDDGIAALSKLTNLRWLSLWLTNLTDRGLEHLEQLRKLDRLDLELTQASEDGLRRLRQRLPPSVKITVVGQGRRRLIKSAEMSNAGKTNNANSAQ